MNNRLIKSLGFALGLLLLLCSGAQARDVTMVTVDWKPYYGAGLPNGGLLNDIVQNAFKQVGHNATIEFIPWTRALKLVAEGDADIVMGAYYNDERAKTYHYSDPFYQVIVGLVARREAGIRRFDELEDLKPFRIGVSRGFANSEEFDAADFLNKDVAKNPTINIQKILRNRTDMMAAAFGIFRFELNKAGGDVEQFVFLDPPLADNKIYIMGSRKTADGQQLIGDFNRGLRQIRSNGTYDKLLKKHGF